MDTQKKAPCIFTLTYIRALTAIQSNNQDLSTAPCKSQAGPMQALHTLNFKFVNFFSIVIQIKPL